MKLNASAKARKKEGLFVAEGIKMFLEAPKQRVDTVYVTDSFWRGGELQEQLGEFHVEVVEDHLFKKCCSNTVTPQGIVTLVKIMSYELGHMVNRDKVPCLLILDGIQDPGNLGTIIRTGEGAGVTGVIRSKDTVDLYNPKTIRSTMGSIYRIPTIEVEELKETILLCKKMGVKLYAAQLEDSKAYDRFDYRQGCGFLIGNEGNGLRKPIAELADHYLTIPMEGQVESLNAAIAATLLVYEAHRQRQ